MTYDPDRHHRRSIRLKGYDYAQAGAYFITIVTQGRAPLFGAVADGDMRTNDAGRTIQTAWDELPGHYPGVQTDAFVVMPNHVHGIIVLVGAAPRGRPGPTADTAHPPGTGQRSGTGQPQGVAPTELSVADVVHRFKTLTTKRYTDGVKERGWPAFDRRLWQRNYYEHVILDTASLDRIREYIENNPARWASDLENPAVGAAMGGRPPEEAWRA